MSAKKFCASCGSPTKEMFNGTYNTDTGEPNRDPVCSQHLCRHGSHSIWNAPYKSCFSTKQKCWFCGKYVRYGGYYY